MNQALVFVAIALTVAPALSAPLKIMPLGDSITAGNDDHSLTPGGYRTTLYGLLNSAGYDFDFVGSQTSNPGPIPDNDHEGRGGAQLVQIRQAMVAPLTAGQPDLVLLLGGTNDVTFSTIEPDKLDVAGIAARFEVLLADIYAVCPSARVLVSNILRAATDEPHIAQSALVNELIPGVLATRALAGQQVSFVDLRSALDTNDYADSLHPSPAGYAKIGEAWFDAIRSLIPPPVPVPGDVNYDGTVDIFDVNLVSDHWGEAGPVGDANGDGTVDIFDVNLVSDHWTGPSSGAAAVAEPSSIVLAALAAASIGVLRSTFP